ncbi:MAG: hypothetical protein ABH871_10195 [Pseudomonadota bacterium]
MSFSDYLNRYNEAIFHRWTHQLAIIAEKAARSELASRAADKAAGIKPSIIRRRSPPRLPLWELDNTMVDLEPPLSETEMDAIIKVLDELEKKYRYCDGWNDGRGNVFFRGTMKSANHFSFFRKIYVNPDFRTIRGFVDRFYELLETENLSIFNSKVYSEAWVRDKTTTLEGERKIIGQEHNVFCIYLPCDNQVVPILHAIEKSAIESETTLYAQKPNSYPKGIHALGGCVILGLDISDHGKSFDNWTSSILWAAYASAERFIQDYPNANTEEIHTMINAALIAELKKVRGVEPKDFLSFPG